MIFRFTISCFTVLLLTFSTSADEERHFSAKQVFNYQQPILFESKFETSGFDLFNLSEDGRYRLVKNDPARLKIADAPGLSEELKAVRFTVPRAANSYRAEISLPSENGFNARWYGVSLYVPAEWEIDSGKPADIVIQWHAVPGNSKPTYPNMSIAIQNNHWFVRRNYGSPQAGPKRIKTKLDDPLQPGRWVSWIIHARWSPKNDGLIQVWRDDQLVYDNPGPNVYGTIGKDYTPYLKTGIYHPEWNLKTDQKVEQFEKEKTEVTKKEIYVRKVVVGSDQATYQLMKSKLKSQ
ncbi:MAG: polysaccharide lyase [Pirellulales bacterium]